MNYLTNINLNKNEIQNAVVQNLGTAPSSPGTGQIYVDTSGTAVLKYWNGSAWVAASGSGSGTVTSVTAANSTITVGGTSTDPTISVGTGSITNSQINASAAIGYSKLDLSASLVNADVATGAAINYSKLDLGTSIVNADISATAAIVYSKLNLATSIVDADINASAAIAYSKIALPTAAINANSQLISSLATPVSSTDAATKGYVDSLVQGLNAKGAVVAASIGSINLTSSPSTLDGITLTAGDRVLLKDQSANAGNGIYIFAASGSALTRATDMDAWAEVPGAYVWVEKGTNNADTAWVCTSDPGGTLGTTAITFAKFAVAGTLSATAPLTITSNVISVGLSARVVNTAGNLDLASGIITAGTYGNITVDTYGRVTAASDLLSSNGIAVRTASNTYTNRTITGTTNRIAVTNGSGVSGNPTIDLDANARTNINAASYYSVAGSSTGTTFTVTQATHGLGTAGNSWLDIIDSVYDITGNPAVKVITDFSINTSTGDVTWTFAVSQTLSNYRFTLVGR